MRKKNPQRNNLNSVTFIMSEILALKGTVHQKTWNTKGDISFNVQAAHLYVGSNTQAPKNAP